MKQRSFSVPFSLLITPTLGKYFFGELTTCGARLFVAWKHQTETYEVTLLLVELGEGCPCQVRLALLWVTHQLRVLVGGASETGLNLRTEPVDPTIFSYGLQCRVVELMEDWKLSCWCHFENTLL